MPISSFFYKRYDYMDNGHFYYITDQYFIDFPDTMLIQNMWPIADEYVKNEYIDSRANIPVRIDGAFEKDLIAKAKKGSCFTTKRT